MEGRSARVHYPYRADSRGPLKDPPGREAEDKLHRYVINFPLSPTLWQGKWEEKGGDGAAYFNNAAPPLPRDSSTRAARPALLYLMYYNSHRHSAHRLLQAGVAYPAPSRFQIRIWRASPIDSGTLDPVNDEACPPPSLRDT